ncbi:MAG: hypothetical protein J3R72DRAFT_459726 [Linnemannia gamsii]|nr:MAG: hypothetical protein J3R72DRAFT_459726 [Linnemannia gamsii]
MFSLHVFNLSRAAHFGDIFLLVLVIADVISSCAVYGCEFANVILNSSIVRPLILSIPSRCSFWTPMILASRQRELLERSVS